MSRKLYVGNLPLGMGEMELKELFARVGPVESVKIMREMDTGRSRGFAFVEMGADEDARKAIIELNTYSVGGRNLKVNEARAKPERQRSGGPRGNRRRFEPRW